jgi:hypothetical protein
MPMEMLQAEINEDLLGLFREGFDMLNMTQANYSREMRVDRFHLNHVLKGRRKVTAWLMRDVIHSVAYQDGDEMRRQAWLRELHATCELYRDSLLEELVREVRTERKAPYPGVHFHDTVIRIGMALRALSEMHTDVILYGGSLIWKAD